ncbi:MAG TPA: DUF4835 family protein [Chitinophagaceae bacterium]|jgi:hypothetical protein|nr:DUF4835 family protein [Chitinophagaceae bacterium]
MRKKYRFIFSALLLLALNGQAQELQARLSVNAAKVGSQVDKKVFQTLQNALTNFLNNRRWTAETFQPNEKIVCNFLLTIAESTADNVYKASLTVQAARPVFNSTYDSPLVNFIDDAVTFKYVEFQPVEFNENRVAGSDPLVSNLTATLAYYVNIILGMNFDSFALKGGDPYFQKAQNIVSNAPDSRDITGWRNFDGQRNRYWLADNLTNSKYALLHDAIYSYFRLGLDNMYDNETEARTAIMNTLNFLNNINTDNPNTMGVQFFFGGRARELIGIFKKTAPDEKSRAAEILAKLDISNANNYKQELR